MAPTFDTLSDHDIQDEEDEGLDFSDLREQYDVRMEEGLDTFCVSSHRWPCSWRKTDNPTGHRRTTYCD